MRLPPQDDAQDHPLCLYEQHLLLLQNRATGSTPHPLYLTGGAGTSRLRDHQPIPQPCKQGDQQYLHTGGASVGRTWLHHA